MINPGTRDFQEQLFGGLAGIGPRRRTWLFKTWAFYFRLWVFPLIDGEMFEPLYSKLPSRPSSPTNILASLLIIQAMFGWSDDMVHEMMMNGNMQILFAVNYLGENLEKVPTCDKALTRFRMRIQEYKLETGIDLMQQLFESVSFGLMALSGVTLSNCRMDSAMVSANVRIQSREGLFFTGLNNVLTDMVTAYPSLTVKLQQKGLDKILEDGAYNRYLYYSNATPTDKLNTMLIHTENLYTMLDEVAADSHFSDVDVSAIKQMGSWVNFERFLSEQTIVENNVRRMATKKDGCMNSRILQSYTDTEATFRTKAGKNFVGYILNLAEAVGPFGSFVFAADLEQNIQTDPYMAKLALDQASSIIAAIDAYNQEFGIENPGDMERCRQVLLEKTRMVEETIREFLDKRTYVGSHIPYDEPDIEQISLDEVLAMCAEAVTVPNIPGQLPGAQPKEVHGVGSKPEGSHVTPTEVTGTQGPAPLDASGEKEHAETAADHPEMTDSHESGIENDGNKDGEGDGRRRGTTSTKDILDYLKGNGISDFAALDPEVQREHLLAMIRQGLPTGYMNTLGEYIIAVDGAYSSQDLIEFAGAHGFQILPTDFTSKNANPVAALFNYDSNGNVKSCPMGVDVIRGGTPCASGQARLIMPSESCQGCPFRNCCKAQEQSRTPTSVILLNPKTVGRTEMEATLGTEEYKNVGRFRNGVETLPHLLRWHYGLDHLPIGWQEKELYIWPRLTAINIRSFILFLQGKSRIKDNPIFHRGESGTPLPCSV